MCLQSEIDVSVNPTVVHQTCMEICREIVCKQQINCYEMDTWRNDKGRMTNFICKVNKMYSKKLKEDEINNH
jgi:hypothetical protein